ncbi:MAG: hypothetical protein FJ088_07890 [Deltaproteobacteria bacterium]|nr:hypothetical protein [Deltaproteobacteria bacterium]
MVLSLIPGRILPRGDGMSVLFVEFINADQFPGQMNEFYSFMKGALNLLGIPNRWVRLGISTDNMAVHGSDEITLSNEELDSLINHALSIKAKRAIFTHAINGKQISTLLENVPDLKEHKYQPLGTFRAFQLMTIEEFEPDFGWEPGNAAASRENPANIHILTENDCYYNVSIRTNPFFAGMEIPTGILDLGCSFCGRPSLEIASERKTIAGKIDSSGAIRKQMKAAAKTYPAGAGLYGMIFRNLAGIPPLKDIHGAMKEAGLLNVRLLFAARPDHILEKSDEISEFLETVRGTGFQFHIHVIGIENFSDEELLRFNKGVAAGTNELAVKKVFELESLFPENFKSLQHLPFCFILFTPWTRISDLILNLEKIRSLGIQNYTGNIFRSRLRIHPDTALVLLADKDGLLADKESGGDRTNRFKMFEEELPWRFKDESVAWLSAVIMRLQEGADAAFAGDPLFLAIRKFLRESFGSFNYNQGILIDIFYHLAVIVRDHGVPGDVEAALRNAFERWNQSDMPGFFQ